MQIVDHTTAVTEEDFMGFSISLVIKYVVTAQHRDRTEWDFEEEEEVEITDVYCNGSAAELTNTFLAEIKNAMSDSLAWDVVDARYKGNWHRREAQEGAA